MRIKLIALLMCIVLAMLPISAAAAPTDGTAVGSVTVTVSYQGKAIGGGTLSLIRVADIVWSEDAYSFLLSDGFQDSGLPLTALDTQETAEQYAAYADENQTEGVTVTVNENGVAVFEDLSVGLYLITRYVCPIEQVAMAPFLLTVPLQIGDESVYNVDASPKVSLVFTPSEGERPDSPDTPGGDTPDEPEFPDSTTAATLSGTTAMHITEPTEPDAPKIPQTGQVKWPIPLLASAGMVCIALGCRVMRGKDRVS